MADRCETRAALPDENALAQAASLLQAGQVVGMPTETVYGLAARADRDDAVKRIFEAKGRPQDNPLIVHIASEDMLHRVVRSFPPVAQKLAKAFWPGPLTMILPKGKLVADGVSAGLDTVGVRFPAHPVARRMIELAELPLAAPSANISGSPSPTTALHVLKDMAGRIPLIIDGGASPVGVESTVVSLVEKPLLLRPGFVTADEMQEVLGQEVDISPGVYDELDEAEKPQSPGLKYRHYAPQAEITLVDAAEEDFARFALRQSQCAGLPQPVYALCFEEEAEGLPVPSVSFGRKTDSASQASQLFAALRRLDELGAKTVYARLPSAAGIGMAVRNRLLRAAAFKVMKL